MRFPHELMLTAVVFGASCVGAVGEDPGTGTRNPKATGCTNPTTVTTPLTIRSDADFAAVPTGCWDLRAKLRVEGPNVASLAKLGQLKGVNELELVDTSIKTIDTTIPLTVWGALTVSGNKQLASLDNLSVEDADDLTTSYTIRNNPLLASLGGVAYANRVEGELRITDNAALAAVVLDELTTVGGALTIANTGATRIDLGSLQTVNRLEIASNPKLTAFDGLAATAIKGDFVLRANPVLASLGAMSSVARIEGTLTLDGNAALANLDAFSGLSVITSALAITNNTSLQNLGRFSHLAGIGSTVTITGNTALPYCAGHEIDHCVTSGTATIANNKPNTQSSQCACWCSTN